MQHYRWPGNVRELENMMEKIMIFSTTPTIECSDLPAEIHCPERSISTTYHSLSLKQAIPALERDYIRQALQQTNGNRAQAAKILEISLRSLQYKIKEYEIKE
ncbi:MAG: hypothetical protein J7K75_11490 [Desulfuromonas sp.]|nr:hypothetical protein [Desulfuromonas sp.]